MRYQTSNTKKKILSVCTLNSVYTVWYQLAKHNGHGMEIFVIFSSVDRTVVSLTFVWRNKRQISSCPYFRRQNDVLKRGSMGYCHLVHFTLVSNVRCRSEYYCTVVLVDILSNARHWRLPLFRKPKHKLLIRNTLSNVGRYVSVFLHFV